MSVFDIVIEPDQRLRQVSQEVIEITDATRAFLLSLLQTMYAENGAGIAAIQVGHAIRSLIIDIPKLLDDGTQVRAPYIIINPVIIELSQEKIILPEGCLSVRGPDGMVSVRGDVARPKSITIRYTDIENTTQTLSFDGDVSEYEKWSARCLQHEIDHLDGILFIDKLVQPKL